MGYEKMEMLLAEKGVSAYRVAKDTGISTTLFYEWKSGKSTPKLDKLQTIAEYFGIPVSFFYDDSSLEEAFLGDGFEVAAGQGRINGSKKSGEYSTVKIVGDSMYPSLHDGDLVTVHHVTDDISPADFAIVKVNGDEVTCKHVEITSKGIWLRAENKDVFEDKFYSVHEVLTLPIVIVGVATEIVSRKL